MPELSHQAIKAFTVHPKSIPLCKDNREAVIKYCEAGRFRTQNSGPGNQNVSRKCIFNADDSNSWTGTGTVYEGRCDKELRTTEG